MVIVAVFGLRATVQTQALMALLVVLLAATAHVALKPFDVKILDKLELYGLLTAFTTLYFGTFTRHIFTHRGHRGHRGHCRHTDFVSHS